ncbi:hypothetical protein Taro_001324, partial [Colocasia esculenta]|nr:hypothetical protein [Colocasia esculenta]
LQVLFSNLDQLLAPDRPCHSSFLEDWKSQLKVPRARIVELAAFPSQPHSRHFQRGSFIGWSGRTRARG